MKKLPSCLPFVTALTVLYLFLLSTALASTLLITNEKSDSVSVFDTETDQVVKTIAVGKTPHAIGVIMNRQLAYTGNRGDDTISVIDINSMKVVKTIKLPHTIMNLEVSPGGRYVSANSRTSLHVSFIDTKSNTIIKTVEVGHWAKHEKGKSAVNMANPDIHAKRGGIMISHDTWSPDSKYLFVPDRFNYRIAKIDVETFQVVDRLQLESPTHHMLVAPNGKSMIALNDGVPKHNVPPSVVFFDMKSLRLENQITMPLAKGEFAQGHHAGFNLDKTKLYFANRGKEKGKKRGRTVMVVDLENRELISTVEAGHGAGHVTPSPDGKYIFILNHYDNIISVLDAQTNDIIKNIKIPSLTPKGSIGHSSIFSEDGRFYYELSETDGKLLIVNAKKMTFSKAIKVGDWPSIMVQIN